MEFIPKPRLTPRISLPSAQLRRFAPYAEVAEVEDEGRAAAEEGRAHGADGVDAATLQGALEAVRTHLAKLVRGAELAMDALLRKRAHEACPGNPFAFSWISYQYQDHPM